ncbi:MAG: glycosyltransferase [Bacteroidales bacterium]|jgi:glycosyltransferase involved in cell wall biosynthesis
MTQRVIIAVTNDLSGDQRVHKVAMSLIGFGYEPVLVGRRMPHSAEISRPYPCRRFRLVFNKGPLFYISFNIRLFFFLLLAKSAVFLANDLDSLPAVFFAGKIRGKKIVYDSHEYFTEVPELVGRTTVRKIWEVIEKFIFPKLTSVYTVNSSIAGIYHEKYGVSVGVVRNVPVANSREFIPGTLPEGFTDRPVIIYQGAVNVGRGLEEMITALTLMPDFHLLIVGDGDILNALEVKVANLNLGSRVHFTGKVPFGQLAWYTQQAALGMSLEQDIGLNYHFALPNKLFDYMHAGIPVIASNLPEIRKVVEEAGFGIIIDQFDPEYLSQTVKSMLYNPELLMMWRERALAAAPDYTWESEEKELQHFFPIIN